MKTRSSKISDVLEYAYEGLSRAAHDHEYRFQPIQQAFVRDDEKIMTFEWEGEQYCLSVTKVEE